MKYKSVLYSFMLLVAFSAAAIGAANLGTGDANAEALKVTSNGDSVTAEPNFSVIVPEINALEITLPAGNLVTLDVSPTPNTASFDKTESPVQIYVGTSNTTGYTLTMTPMNGNVATTDLTRTEQLNNTTFTIPTLASKTGGYTENEFENGNSVTNAWGYSIVTTNITGTSSNYFPATTEAILLNQNSAAVNSDLTEINLAAKANSETPGGTYEVKLRFTATVNPTGPHDIADISTMQMFKSLTRAEYVDVEASMTKDEPYRLQDTRDGNYYWITKYQIPCTNPRVGQIHTATGDNNCYQIWMSQNLDLNLETDGTDAGSVKALTNANTDINSATGIYSNGYTSTTSDGVTTISWTPSVATVSAVGSTSNQQTTPQSLNTGNEYYYAGASASTTCTNSGYTTVTEKQNNCMHWHVGNYYNWTAAVASNDSSNQTANYTTAANSICPAGWRLPTGLTSSTCSNSDQSGCSDFNFLLVQYGIAVNYVESGTATWSNNGYSNIQNNPIYTTRSGYFYGGGFLNQASYGLLWSGTTYSGTRAYNLNYNSSYVYPASNYNRQRGFPVRCIARVPEA